MSFLPLVKLWLWISTLATTTGWILSAFGQLNRRGYVMAGIAWLLLILVGRKSWSSERTGAQSRSQWKAFGRRLSRPLPLMFAVLAALIFLGAALYAPTNHTALTYRTPRVLQWLAHEKWFWIHTSNYRMNDRACGIEWLSAPLLLFTRSDRSLFLLNFIPFLLLPGLLFSLFTRLGVTGKVAWYWMWLLPTGYTFLLQAGSIGNDTFPTVYALAALDFACRAWVRGGSSDLGYSILAAALLTGAKASNLPLLAPWGVVFFPVLWRRFGDFRKQPAQSADRKKRRPLRAAALLLIAGLGLLVSFIPTALLNIFYCGDWSGLALERTGMEMHNPVVGIWGNTLLFLLDNLVPPFLPGANWWNQHALEILPPMLVRPLVNNFEASFHWIWELQTEDWAGIGFGLSWMLLFLFGAALKGPIRLRSPAVRPDAPPGTVRVLVIWASWFALLAYCVKSGMSTGARLISPYYPLLLPLLLVLPRQSQIVRQKAWRLMVWAVLLLAVPVVALTPGRPLWPARTLLDRLHSAHPQQRLIARALNVYSVYSTRADPLADVRALLPPHLKVVGFMARGDDTDISLWRPFGQRRVEHVLCTDPAASIRERSIEYIVAGDHNFGLNNTSFADWIQTIGAQLVATTNATIRVSEGAQTWYLVRLPPHDR